MRVSHINDGKIESCSVTEVCPLADAIIRLCAYTRPIDELTHPDLLKALPATSTGTPSNLSHVGRPDTEYYDRSRILWWICGCNVSSATFITYDIADAASILVCMG